jgi:spermidine/putrescine transport system ATP-binding protein
MRGKDVRLEGVRVTYPNGFTAVQPTDLTVEAGQFFSILGPSGCGKTTILRCLSGFIDPTEGQVLIGGENQVGVPPNNRPTALIFQNLALFPLMTVWENVAFGLESRGIAKTKRRERAIELLELVALGGQSEKKPTELSGGQRQRVAVARALAVEPAVLLLDEPLSALDLKLRQHMRAELRSIQQRTGVTFIYITHDQGEALTMSDSVAVMNAGIIEQVGTGDEIYSNPATPFVASFVGETNVFHGKITERDGKMAYIDTDLGRFFGANTAGLDVGAEAMLFIRPENLHLAAAIGEEPHGNELAATVERRDLEGPFVNLFLNAQGRELSMHITNSGAAGSDLNGEQKIGFSCENAMVLPRGPLAKTGREMVGP